MTKSAAGPTPPIVVPTLKNGTVRLESFGPDHLTDTYVSWLRDSHVMRFSEQRHRSHDVESCRAYWQAMQQGGHPLWAIMLNDGAVSRHVGTISASVDYPNRSADIGILVGDRAAQGKGVGGRAWQLVCDYLLGPAAIRRISAGTMSINKPMLQIMRRTGMIEEGRRREYFLVDGEPVDLVMFALFRPAEAPQNTL
jgi:[ribosomal protein S5]-alanine N-acetyltransferase